MRRTIHNPTSSQVLKAFEDSFIPEPNSGCWLWIGPTFKKRGGYGSFSCGNYYVKRAHRVSWELYHHPITREQHVLHKCDNPVCVNPEHLFLGNQALNMFDKAMKGRQLEGPASGAYKHGKYVGDNKNFNYPTGITEPKN
jgi:hypothetical protein